MESLTSYRESDLAASIPEAYEVMGPPNVEIFDAVFQTIPSGPKPVRKQRIYPFIKRKVKWRKNQHIRSLKKN